MASEAISEHLNFLGEHAPISPLVLHAYADTHVTPLLELLATGLLFVPIHSCVYLLSMIAAEKVHELKDSVVHLLR